METIEKYNTKKLKEEIKVASAYQRFLKNQRKTEKIVGNREMPASEATWKHTQNREKLSAMYVAYGIMRGKDLDEQIKAHVSKKNDLTVIQDGEKFSYNERRARSKVEELLLSYKIKEVEIVNEN